MHSNPPRSAKAADSHANSTRSRQWPFNGRRQSSIWQTVIALALLGCGGSSLEEPGEDPGDELASDALPLVTAADGLVSIEIERADSATSSTVSGTTWSWTASAQAGASGGTARVAGPDAGRTNDTGYVTTSPRLDYQINFGKPGRYHVWLRGYGPGGGSDSCHVGLDGVAVASADRLYFWPNAQWVWSRSTNDGAVATLDVATAGLHTVNVWMREDGTILDKLVLATDPAYVPSGTGPAESPRVPTTPTCTPSCTGKQCGSDGCGGTCGACASGQVCSASYQCATATTSSGSIKDVKITPSFETAGVIVTLDRDPSGMNVTLEVCRPGESSFRPQHPFVRYDARHMATSLFELAPATTYEIRVADGAGSTVRTFTTRREISLPAPLRVVPVSDRAALQAALDAALPGDEIRIAAGTYTGGLRITRSGTADRPIVVSGVLTDADRARPIEQRQALPRIAGGSSAGFTFAGVAHVVLQHVRVSGNQGPGIDVNASRHCIVQSNQVYDNHEGTSDWSYNFNVVVQRGGASAGYNIIQGNHIADTSTAAFATEGSYKGVRGITYFGIRAQSKPGPGLVIRKNRIENQIDCMVPCPDERDDPGEAHTDALAYREQSSHDVEVYDNTMLRCRDDAIEADGFCVNARIYRNKSETTNNAISIAPALPGPFFWVRNKLTRYVESGIKHNTSSSVLIRGHYFYHNTFNKLLSEGEAAVTLWGGTPSKDLFYKNNIFTAPRTLVDGDAHKPVWNGNLWYSPVEASNWLTWFRSSTGQEQLGVWGNPLLDALHDLAAGSPAIDAAIRIPGINDRFTGARPDIGADEAGM